MEERRLSGGGGGGGWGGEDILGVDFKSTIGVSGKEGAGIWRVCEFVKEVASTTTESRDGARDGLTFDLDPLRPSSTFAEAATSSFVCALVAVCGSKDGPWSRTPRLPMVCIIPLLLLPKNGFWSRINGGA